MLLYSSHTSIHEKRRVVIMIEYAIKIYFNNERKGKVYLYFSLDFTEFILNFIEFYRVFE